MKKLILTALLSAATVFGSTVYPGYFEVETPEGNKFEMKLKGDRTFNWYETKKGERLRFMQKSEERPAGFYHMKIRVNGVEVSNKTIDQERMPRNPIEIKNIDRQLNKIWEIKKVDNERSLSRNKVFKSKFEINAHKHEH